MTIKFLLTDFSVLTSQIHITEIIFCMDKILNARSYYGDDLSFIPLYEKK